MDSTNQFSFKKYLASKKQLMQAINETPYQLIKYRITKYCKLEISGTDEDALSLKPNNELMVEWVYPDKDNATIAQVILLLKESNRKITVSRDSTKFQKWLNSNSIIVE